jgi:hypothetical protein
MNCFSIRNHMEYVHGLVDWVHGSTIHWFTVLIKHRSLTKRSVAQIGSREPIPTLLIRVVDQALDGRGTSSSVRWCSAMVKTCKSSSSRHWAWKATRFLPTRPRNWEELISQTYGGENDPLDAGDDSAVQPAFNDGGGWCPVVLWL